MLRRIAFISAVVLLAVLAVLFAALNRQRFDVDVLIGRIELTVGRDLQYIRFNGAMIGGLAGLALHALEQGLKLYL